MTEGGFTKEEANRVAKMAAEDSIFTNVHPVLSDEGWYVKGKFAMYGFEGEVKLTDYDNL